MASVTDIDFEALVRQLLPSALRKPRLIAWLKVLLSPISGYLYEWFKKFEQKGFYDIKYQYGTVQALEYVLNDLMGLDPDNPSIILGPGNIPDRLYVPLRLEADPIYLGTVYVHRRADYLYGIYDFKIIIDDSLEGVIDEEMVRAIADRYKRDGKTYIISYETV